MRTYRAVLEGNHVEWADERPILNSPTEVVVTILNDAVSGASRSPCANGEQMAAALERLSKIGALVGIDDPLAWERETRVDRRLPGRDD